MQKIQSRLDIVFIAFLFSSLVYLIVGFALSKSGWQAGIEGNMAQVLFAIFLALSIAVIVLVLQIKARTAPVVDDASAQKFFSRFITLFALAEVPAILGLALFFLTAKFVYLLSLCIVSVMAFLLVKPRV